MNENFTHAVDVSRLWRCRAEWRTPTPPERAASYAVRAGFRVELTRDGYVVYGEHPDFEEFELLICPE